MTEAEICAELTRIMRNTFKNPSLVALAEMGVDQVPGWNSLMLVNVIVAVENSFGFEIGPGEATGLRSVGDFVRLIRSKQLQAIENS